MAAQSDSSVALSHHTISHTAARKVADAALQVAAQHGWNISVAVVDRAGELVTLDRADHAIGISPAVAQGKARTAALLQAPSKEFETFINSGKPSFLATPGVTPLEGGVPIWLHGEVIGAVGISGAHGENDSLVAIEAALALGE
ncbi:GlcG/HbpS family heme-binding protein [Pantoea sp. A4]|uniref:GlcG/HbpS family heme-binding protein n=1 Tax=Pantoea sp. A4 TaxID=1225184 RepID=UPI000366C78B|nr:heme-binding protein [Pantoea sp. A4]